MTIQHRMTKMIPKIKDMTYEDRLKFLKLPSLVFRRKRGDMIMMDKAWVSSNRFE